MHVDLGRGSTTDDRAKNKMRLPAVVGRRAFVNHLCVAAAAVGLSSPLSARAWCGERFPSWAYYLKWDEVDVPFEFRGSKGAVRYRIVGDTARESKTGVPPILVVGAPGVGYDYMENFEALAVSDRRVIEVTFAGTGPPSNLPAALLTAEACAAQLAAVCDALKVPTVHVVAHGLGASPALQFASASGGGGAGAGVGVRSLTLISPYASTADLRADKLVLPDGGGKDAAALAGALLPTVSSNARTTCIAEARSAMSSGGSLLPPLLVARGGGGGGSSSSAATSSEEGAPPADDGRLGRVGALGARLARLGGRVPVLLTSGGAADIVEASGWTDLPPSTRRVTFGGSGHLPFIEQNEQFLVALLDFLDEVDGVETNRELKFADPLKTIKELT